MSAKQGPTHLTADERGRVVRETFEAIASVGFMKWQAEELLGWGYEVGEDDRQFYLREYEKNHFAEFQKLSANASDDRLLDARAYWIDKANTMGLAQWLEILSQGDGGRPFYAAVEAEVQRRGSVLGYSLLEPSRPPEQDRDRDRSR